MSSSSKHLRRCRCDALRRQGSEADGESAVRSLEALVLDISLMLGVDLLGVKMSCLSQRCHTTIDT